jgi:HAMP domain-containing protein
MSSPWSQGFLRTRVARRILLLFLVCAVLPVSGLAWLGYDFVATRLEENARQELRAQSKTAGLFILDRLASLGAMLELTANAQATQVPALAPGAVPVRLPGTGFRSITVVRPGAPAVAVLGTPPELPPLAEAGARQVGAGGVALVVDPGRVEPRVFLVRRVGEAAGALVWGELDAGTIWGTDDGRSPEPEGMLICLVAGTEPLRCPDRGALAPLALPDDGSAIRWESEGGSYLAGRWTLFLGKMYAAPSWTIMLSRPAEEVFAPLRLLRRTFLLGLGLALALVFALSHVQLRRTMEPLAALEAATRRLALGDFTEPVQVASKDEFQVLATSFNRMAGEVARELGTQRALQELGRAALEGSGAEDVVAALGARAEALLGPGTLTVALARPDEPERWRVLTSGAATAHDGVRPSTVELTELAEHPGGFVVRSGEPSRSYLHGAGTPSPSDALVLPLLREGTLGGALVLEGPVGEGDAALERARRFAEPIGVALVSTQLVEQLEALNWGALTALARAIDAVSPWTAGHSERVTLGALEIGRRLGLPEAELDLLHRGGLLHDIGKVGVPATLLDKPGPLTPEEYATVQRHPTIGATILSPITAFRPVLPLVLSHHELLDGSGYPDRLSGDAIPFLVRVMTVADVFDALTSDRPYRPAWTVERALGLLLEQAGRKFDPRVVGALAEAVREGWRPGMRSEADGEAALAEGPAGARRRQSPSFGTLSIRVGGEA